MGLVNTVVPLDRLEAETVQWCREMLALSPFALRLVKSCFNAHEDGYAGIQQLAHDANLLFYGSEEAQEGREAYKAKRAPDFSKFPRRLTMGATAERPSAVRIWLMAARPRTLPTGAAPVLVGTALAQTMGDFHGLRFVAALLGALLIQVGANLSNDYSDARRGADTEDRLGPVRVTAGGLVPPRQVLVATYVAFGARGALRRLPDRHAPAGSSCWSASRRSSPACSTPAARGPTATRGWARSSSSCSSASPPWPAPTSRRRRPGTGRHSRCRSRSACWPRRCWWSTTCATWRRTGGRASARSPSGSAASARAVLYAVMVLLAFPLALVPWLAGSLDAWLLLSWLVLPIAAAADQDRARARRRADAQPRARGHAMMELVFCLLLSAGILLS